jgi:hypothetical protein
VGTPENTSLIRVPEFTAFEGLVRIVEDSLVGPGVADPVLNALGKKSATVTVKAGEVEDEVWQTGRAVTPLIFEVARPGTTKAMGVAATVATTELPLVMKTDTFTAFGMPVATGIWLALMRMLLIKRGAVPLVTGTLLKVTALPLTVPCTPVVLAIDAVAIASVCPAVEPDVESTLLVIPTTGVIKTWAFRVPVVIGVVHWTWISGSNSVVPSARM